MAWSLFNNTNGGQYKEGCLSRLVMLDLYFCSANRSRSYYRDQNRVKLHLKNCNKVEWYVFEHCYWNISLKVVNFFHFPHSRVWDVTSSYSTEKLRDVVEVLFSLGVSKRVQLISLNSSRRNSIRVISKGKCNFHDRWELRYLCGSVRYSGYRFVLLFYLTLTEALVDF